MEFKLPIKSKSDSNSLRLTQALYPALGSENLFLIKKSLMSAFEIFYEDSKKIEKMASELVNLAETHRINLQSPQNKVLSYHLRALSYKEYLEQLSIEQLTQNIEMAWVSIAWWDRQTPDYGYWKMMAYWKFEEAASLLFGLNPEHCGLSEIEAYKKYSNKINSVAKLLNVMRRKWPSEQSVERREFLQWCMDEEIPVVDELKEKGIPDSVILLATIKDLKADRDSLIKLNEELAESLRKNTESENVKAALAQQESMPNSERTKMLKLIAALSVLCSVAMSGDKKYFIRNSKLNRNAVWDDIDTLFNGWKQVNRSNVLEVFKAAHEAFPEFESLALYELKDRLKAKND